jgi:hypothetical protein
LISRRRALSLLCIRYEVNEAVVGGGATPDERLLAVANGRTPDLNAVRQALQARADFAFEDAIRFARFY